jgi:hypothetical protein
LWIVFIGTANYDVVRRPTGEAWVVTASEKNPYRPALVRANVRFDAASRAAGAY